MMFTVGFDPRARTGTQLQFVDDIGLVRVHQADEDGRLTSHVDVKCSEIAQALDGESGWVAKHDGFTLAGNVEFVKIGDLPAPVPPVEAKPGDWALGNIEAHNYVDPAWGQGKVVNNHEPSRNEGNAPDREQAILLTSDPGNNNGSPRVSGREDPVQGQNSGGETLAVDLADGGAQAAASPAYPLNDGAGDDGLPGQGAEELPPLPVFYVGDIVQSRYIKECPEMTVEAFPEGDMFMAKVCWFHGDTLHRAEFPLRDLIILKSNGPQVSQLGYVEETKWGVSAEEYHKRETSSVPDGFAPGVVKLVRERGSDYGTPADNHQLTADMWSLWLSRRLRTKIVLTGEDVCMLNVLQKQSRLAFKTKDDSWFDVSGYTENVAMLRPEQRNK